MINVLVLSAVVLFSGYFDIGGYLPGNEFDHPGNRVGYVPRYSAETYAQVDISRLFLFVNPELYLGRSLPRQGGYEPNYDADFQVMDLQMGVGYNITDNISFIIDHGRTLDLGPYYQGDRFLWTRFKLRFTLK